MAITKQKKVEILSSLSSALKGSLAGVFVSFKGLTVSEVNALRDELKKDAVRYRVVKKTLLKRALVELGLTGDQPELPGEVAFAYLTTGDDVTAPARGLHTFVKKYKEKLAFLGGYINGTYLSRDAVKDVATIPPIPVLRGMFANIINSPIQRFAIGLAEVAKTKN
jgi:large subunit ribosomal protein L10